jgi:hypothetical protein
VEYIVGQGFGSVPTDWQILSRRPKRAAIVPDPARTAGNTSKPCHPCRLQWFSACGMQLARFVPIL